MYIHTRIHIYIYINGKKPDTRRGQNKYLTVLCEEIAARGGVGHMVNDMGTREQTNRLHVRVYYSLPWFWSV